MDLPYNYNTTLCRWQEVPAPNPQRGDVQMLSGCHSHQTSADINSTATGAGRFGMLFWENSKTDVIYLNDIRKISFTFPRFFTVQVVP